MIKYTIVGLALSVGLTLAAATVVKASGPVGIFAIVEKVVFEPNEANADRIQIWGAFAYVDVGPVKPVSRAQRGYMYFAMPAGLTAANQTVIRNEWADLKSVAGTGQGVGFGRWVYMGPFEAMSGFYAPQGGSAIDLRVRRESDLPANPAPYVTNVGVIKLSESTHAPTLKQLKDALAAK